MLQCPRAETCSEPVCREVSEYCPPEQHQEHHVGFWDYIPRPLGLCAGRFAGPARVTLSGILQPSVAKSPNN